MTDKRHPTFRLEALGETILDRLLDAAGSANPVYREGAVLGLGKAVELAVFRLSELAKTDPSPGVRETAAEVLDSIFETQGLREKS